MAKYIVNADDYGMSERINMGVVELYKHGIITDATVMVTRGNLKKSVELAERAGLPLGLHLDLDVPLKRDEFGIDARGVIKVPEGFWSDTLLNQIRGEIQRQLEFLLATGIEITHLDSHHHVHAFIPVLNIVCEEMARYGIKYLRFYPEFYSTQEDADLAREIMDRYNIRYPATLLTPLQILQEWENKGRVPYKDKHTDEIVEVMVHVELPDSEPETWREKEYANMPKLASVLGLDNLISYKQLLTGS